MARQCDESCPTLAETRHLLSKVNKININNPIFKSHDKLLIRYGDMIDKYTGETFSVVSENTALTADLITYAGICKYWKGNQLNGSVFNLKYSSYLDQLQNSWSIKGDDDNIDLRVAQVWIQQAKVLVISGLDYVNFKDFPCQTLLTILQNISSDLSLTTIVVTPKLSNLVGNSNFFSPLTSTLKKVVKAN
jgi:hypothetical protein